MSLRFRRSGLHLTLVFGLAIGFVSIAISDEGEKPAKKQEEPAVKSEEPAVKPDEPAVKSEEAAKTTDEAAPAAAKEEAAAADAEVEVVEEKVQVAAPAAPAVFTPLAPLVPGVGPQAGAVPSPPVVVQPGVQTVFDERLDQLPVGIEAGQLVMPGEPARKIPLDEIAYVLFFVPTPSLSVQYLGQDNHDLASPSTNSGGNGIQDVHLKVSGLPETPIKQIVVEGLNGAMGVWRLDPTGTPNWRIAKVQNEGSPEADLYLEPNITDSNGQMWQVTISFEDGTSLVSPVNVTSNTNNQLKVTVAPENTPPAAMTSKIGVVHLVGGGKISGEITAVSEDRLTIVPSWKGELKIPFTQIQGVWFGTTDSAEGKQRFIELISSGVEADVAQIVGRDGKVADVNGKANSFSNDKLSFEFDGKARSVDRNRLAGLVFAGRKSAETKGAYQVVQLAGGESISGSWTGLNDNAISITTSWGDTIEIARASVKKVSTRNGKVVYLSDLDPAKVVQVPYFDRLLPFRRDSGLTSGQLKVNGVSYPKGLALHSRTVLTYTIGGEFATFKAVLGYEDTQGRRGRTACRILGDGKELLALPDFRADGQPQPLEFPVEGVKELTIEVDFGMDEDVGDRVVLADPRLFRGASK